MRCVYQFRHPGMKANRGVTRNLSVVKCGLWSILPFVMLCIERCIIPQRFGAGRVAIYPSSSSLAHNNKTNLRKVEFT